MSWFIRTHAGAGGSVKHTGDADGGKWLQTYLIGNQSFEFLQRMNRYEGGRNAKTGRTNQT